MVLHSRRILVGLVRQHQNWTRPSDGCRQTLKSLNTLNNFISQQTTSNSFSTCPTLLRAAQTGLKVAKETSEEVEDFTDVSTVLSSSTGSTTVQPSLMTSAFDTIDKYGTLPALDEKKEREYFKDFRFYVNFEPMPEEDITDERFRGFEEKDKPLVLLFGWAGANKKNLEKYTDIYREAGCLTLSYNLPTRFIFEITSQVPYLTSKLMDELRLANVSQRPVIFHLLSDTGAMVYQGLDYALRHRGLSLDVRGMVMDSCPGERPKVTFSKIMALMIVNWVCSRRDGLSYAETIGNNARLLRERALPSFFRLLKGQEPVYDTIEGKWSGDSLRFPRPDQQGWPELFLYSKTDFYLPHKYLEDKVIGPRLEAGRDVTTKRWDKSPHVCHLKKHKNEYKTAVQQFLHQKYFQPLKSSAKPKPSS